MRGDARLLAVLGAAAGLAVANLGDWWEVAWSSTMLGDGQVGVSGSTGTSALASLLPAIVLAVVLTMLTLGSGGRRVVAALGTLASAGMVALGAAGTLAEGVVAQQVPLTVSAADAVVTATGLAWGYVAAGGVAALACLAMVLRPPARRAPRVRAASGEMTDPLASWKAMDAGLDPTDEGERA